MLRKFECQNCHTHFEADDQQMVNCPKCQSDNVEYEAAFPSKKRQTWGLSVITVICLAAVLAFSVNKCGKETDTNTDNSLNPSEADTIKFVSDSDFANIVIPEEIQEPPTIVCSPLKFANGTYSFTVEIAHKPNSPYYVAIVEHRGTKEIARSDDNMTFEGIAPSKMEEGIYDIAVFDSESGTRLATMEKTGFTPPVSQRMTKEQLQALIDNDDESLYGLNKQIAENCKLVFTGLPADAKKPETIADVMDRIGRMWSEVKVSDLQYDSENRISAITFIVKFPE